MNVQCAPSPNTMNHYGVLEHSSPYEVVQLFLAGLRSPHHLEQRTCGIEGKFDENSIHILDEREVCAWLDAA